MERYFTANTEYNVDFFKKPKSQNQIPEMVQVALVKGSRISVTD
jgi:hypothetical protein